MHTDLGGGYLSDPQVAHKLVTSPEAHQVFWDVINEGKFNFQPRVISLPELPILDSSPTPIISSRFPMLGAKFGESKKNGFDFIMLPPWAGNIHINRFSQIPTFRSWI